MEAFSLALLCSPLQCRAFLPRQVVKLQRPSFFSASKTIIVPQSKIEESERGSLETRFIGGGGGGGGGLLLLGWLQAGDSLEGKFFWVGGRVASF